ncbi:unnamed protein product [marine sediment metagenome]|uniref:Uncharacterized protein n=1 Tax=marine sediment metagenome TaxID=412755 RepID=X1RWV7_9ZZZZ
MVVDRDPLLWPLETTLIVADGEILLTPPFSERGRVWVCEHVAVMNENTREPEVDVGICHGGTYFWFDTGQLTTRGVWYPFRFNVTLLTDYQIAIRWGNCSIGDHVYATVNGYIREPYTSP